MKVNKKAKDRRVDQSARLAGGFGAHAAAQSPAELLRRSVLANLLWEDQFYEDGTSVADNIKALVPRVDPEAVASIAVEARTKQKLRHVPLLLAREMAQLDTHKHLVGDLLPQIIRRADEITEFVALYWMDGRQPLSKQVKRGLQRSFARFDAYHLAKYNRRTAVKLRDVARLVRPDFGRDKKALFHQLVDDQLPTPDTWEVALSGGEDKRAAWERLIKDKKLGALAFVRNLRNMEEVGVAPALIRQAFKSIDPQWLLPLNFLTAARHAPRWERELEALMLQGLAKASKLPGHTILVADVSGSMAARISGRSQMSRMDCAAAMVMLAAELCEHVTIYATAGSDARREHKTAMVRPRRGFALASEVTAMARKLGGGGIFTRQCLEYIRDKERETPDRIAVFSDSQDCDHRGKRTPKPFGRHNYIIDVSAHARGIKYEGAWTAEIAGWSEHFLTYVAAYEGLSLPESQG